MVRYCDNHRDANEADLLTTAEKLGAHWREGPPLDGWVFVRGKWMPVEIKNPAREGRAREYTPAQQRFLTWCRNRSAPWWVWRTTADVMRDLGAR